MSITEFNDYLGWNRRGIILYLQWGTRVSFIRIGSPPRKCVPPLVPRRRQHSLAGEGAGGANSDDWRESLAFCLLGGWIGWIERTTFQKQLCSRRKFAENYSQSFTIGWVIITVFIPLCRLQYNKKISSLLIFNQFFKFRFAHLITDTLRYTKFTLAFFLFLLYFRHSSFIFVNVQYVKLVLLNKLKKTFINLVLNGLSIRNIV
jgi:hypothetical protein